MTVLARAAPARADTATARVMICDDSLVIRGAISRMLEADPAIKVVAKVSNGRAAIEELRRTQVDVLVLDIEMPVLDGMAALPLLLRADPGLRPAGVTAPVLPSGTTPAPGPGAGSGATPGQEGAPPASPTGPSSPPAPPAAPTSTN